MHIVLFQNSSRVVGAPCVTYVQNVLPRCKIDGYLLYTERTAIMRYGQTRKYLNVFTNVDRNILFMPLFLNINYGVEYKNDMPT